MDRSEWVRVLANRWDREARDDHDRFGPLRDRPGNMGESARTVCNQAYTKQACAEQLLAAAPPAEQASGEWSRAANELRRAEALANKSDKIDRHKVIGKAANNNLTAILDALSQRPVVGSCTWTVESHPHMDAWASACGELWQFEDGGPEDNNVKFCHGCGKPVAPQQHEKGETP